MTEKCPTCQHEFPRPGEPHKGPRAGARRPRPVEPRPFKLIRRGVAAAKPKERRE